jgi:nucleoid DNA-binding protein
MPVTLVLAVVPVGQVSMPHLGQFSPRSSTGRDARNAKLGQRVSVEAYDELDDCTR